MIVERGGTVCIFPEGTRWSPEKRDRAIERLRTDDPAAAERAERLGVSRKTINTVENGVFIPSTVLALKLARALKAKVEDLFWLE